MGYGNKSLDDLMDEVAEVNKANGWFDEDRPFTADIALLHSEVSEMFEGWRKHDPINVAEEMADIFIRILDTCYRNGIDLQYQYNLKMEVNRNRAYRHGGKAV